MNAFNQFPQTSAQLEQSALQQLESQRQQIMIYLSQYVNANRALSMNELETVVQRLQAWYRTVEAYLYQAQSLSAQGCYQLMNRIQQELADTSRAIEMYRGMQQGQVNTAMQGAQTIWAAQQEAAAGMLETTMRNNQRIYDIMNGNCPFCHNYKRGFPICPYCGHSS